MAILIFTDLDGTLLNSDDYDYRPALPVIESLKNQHIPLIPVTSKTRAEVEDLRAAIALNDPFIVENGSGVFIQSGDTRFLDSSELSAADNYYVYCLGGDYSAARSTLAQVAADLGITLRGFGDLSLQELRSLTGLSTDEAAQAQKRDFTEPFLTPDAVSKKNLQEAIARLGWRVVVGDRFSHLIGSRAGKGRAVRWLQEQYQGRSGDRLLTIGLGNSPNDLEMLESVDIPVIIPGKEGVHPELSGRGWRVAPAIGSVGWAAIVRDIGTELRFNLN
jgi:mannosyl-3-phosphoglycerate phosphatase